MKHLVVAAMALALSVPAFARTAAHDTKHGAHRASAGKQGAHKTAHKAQAHKPAAHKPGAHQQHQRHKAPKA